jgi:hypothetical protein
MFRPALSLTGLIVACAGIGLFAAIGVYVWSLKAEVNRQSEVLARRANAAGDAADHAIDFVRKVIDQAEVDLAAARKAAIDAPPATPVNPFVQWTARKATQDLAGSVERAHGAIVVASDAVVVADTTLELVGEFPELKQLLGVNPEQMSQTKSALGNASSDLRQAKTVLGFPVSGPGAAPTAEQLHAVDDALGRGKQFADDADKVVRTARKRVNDLKATADTWSLRIAVATAAVCLLAAVGQFFLARFCWRTLRGQPA